MEEKTQFHREKGGGNGASRKKRAHSHVALGEAHSASAQGHNCAARDFKPVRENANTTFPSETARCDYPKGAGEAPDKPTEPGRRGRLNLIVGEIKPKKLGR